MSNPDPGWYPDTTHASLLRYWDGQQWTEHTAPGQPPVPRPYQGAPTGMPPTGPPPGQGNWFLRHKVFTALAAVLAVLVVALVIGAAVALTGSGDSETVSDSPSRVASSQPAESESTEATPTPEPEPSLTVSQENAVEKAEEYLKYTPFSRKGLISQLKYEKYSTEDAVFAVDSLDIDYDEQAVKAAKSYLDSSAFSRQGLIDQLKYEGYTPEQARFGVSKSGL